MIDRLTPKPHKTLEEILKLAKRGFSSQVDRAVLNGDLANLSELEQRRIVAMAHDYSAFQADTYLIPLTDERVQQKNDWIKKEIDIAATVFFKADGKDLKEQIRDFNK